MEKIVSWFNYYKGEITWFIIGFLFFAGLDEFGKENYIMASIDFVLAYINFKCYSRH